MYKKIFIVSSILCVISLMVLAGVLISHFRSPQGYDNNKQDPQYVDNTDEIKNPNNNDISSPSEIDNQDPVFPDTDDTSNNDDELPGENDEVYTEPIVLAFAGDVSLHDNSRTVTRYDREQKGILGGISSDLLEIMRAANIFMINNEFAFSTRGKPANKSFTFRAHPNRVSILEEMGVNIVSLANNHTLDYGQDALLDTFETLENAGIDYVGAGRNLDRAKAAIYYTIGDKTIAYLAASRVIFSVDWYATNSRPGMIGTYDPALLLECIEEAAANADYVIVYLHWGEERNFYPVKYQKDFARRYIDAGADAVIGAHPHVMQGIEFYKGKPIAYSLSNFWFNNTAVDSGLFQLILEPNGEVKVQLLPVKTANAYTWLLTEKEERDQYFKFMESISFGVTFDENGFVTEKTE